MNAPNLALARLVQLSIVRVTGSDATAFLQAQLSQRVDRLSAQHSTLAGWHDARGRLRAVFRVLKSGDGYLLEAPSELAEPLCATLRMFVLRADVVIEVTELVCAGIIAERSDAASAGLDLPADVNAVTTDDELLGVCVAPGCWHVIGPANKLPGLLTAQPDSIIAAEIRAGLPFVGERTTLRYVPHMLNLDKLDAIDFEKGCYPGQEIIARTEHLGRVKRRARAFEIAADAAPEFEPAIDTPIVDRNGERVGEVLRAAREADGTVVLLAVATLDALDDGLFLDTSAGSPLTAIALPFE